MAMRSSSMKKPTDRELGVFLREITGRMPSFPRPEGEVRITKTKYKGADRFELIWRDPTNTRRKLWCHNWRHAMAAAKWANAQLDAAKGKTAASFNDAADAWLKHQELRIRAGDIEAGTVLVYRHHVGHARKRFGKMPLQDIESRHIRGWLLENAEKYKFYTLNDWKGTIFSVLKHAVEEKLLSVNPLVVMPVRDSGTV